MRIAIIGSGIAGLTAAYLLHRKHDITLFEQEDRLGGHTATVDVDTAAGPLAIDTGFIVYNERTYPNFIALLDELGVASQPTRMGFSVSDPVNGVEYAGSGLNALFSRRSSVLDPEHWRMLSDIMRFNKEAVADWQGGHLREGVTLGDYLQSGAYSAAFRDRYLIPMGSAIWSAPLEQVLAFPVEFFVRFFHHHGLLQLRDRPRWRVIKGGSREYLEPLTRAFADRIHLATRVLGVERLPKGVRLTVAQNDEPRDGGEFDAVVFACHSDQALGMLQDASPLEQKLLGDIPYANNTVVLHTDTRLLPDKRRAWSSWNYRLQADTSQLPLLTYNMNILQGLSADKTYCVTLNADDQIDPAHVIQTFNYAHPQFSLASLSAQERWQEINGVNNTWFCGAYWANGFHEDGVVSAMRVARHLGVDC